MSPRRMYFKKPGAYTLTEALAADTATEYSVFTKNGKFTWYFVPIT